MPPNLAHFVCQIGSSPCAPADLSRRESRYLTQKCDKYFDAFTRQIFLPLAFYMDQKMGYREFQTSVNSHIVQCEHHLVAVLFVCGKSVLEGTSGYRGVVNTAVSTLRCQRCGVAPPLRVWAKFLYFPAIRKPNKLFLLKFLPRFFKKAGKFSPSLSGKASVYSQTK